MCKGQPLGRGNRIGTAIPSLGAYLDAYLGCWTLGQPVTGHLVIGQCSLVTRHFSSGSASQSVQMRPVLPTPDSVHAKARAAASSRSFSAGAVTEMRSVFGTAPDVFATRIFSRNRPA